MDIVTFWKPLFTYLQKECRYAEGCVSFSPTMLWSCAEKLWKLFPVERRSQRSTGGLSFLQCRADNRLGKMGWLVACGKCLSFQWFSGVSCRPRLWHSHSGAPQGGAGRVPRGLFPLGQEATFCKSWLYVLAAGGLGTLLTTSKPPFPRLCNQDNASTHLIG